MIQQAPAALAVCEEDLARAEWYARDIRKGLRVLARDPSALRWELLWFGFREVYPC